MLVAPIFSRSYSTFFRMNWNYVDLYYFWETIATTSAPVWSAELSLKLTRECFNFRMALWLETYTVRKSVKSYARSHFQILLSNPRYVAVTSGKLTKIDENRPLKLEAWKHVVKMWNSGRVDNALGYTIFAFFRLEFNWCFITGIRKFETFEIPLPLAKRIIPLSTIHFIILFIKLENCL